MEERFFITGATGCIGSWIVRNLVREGVPVSVIVRGNTCHRMELIMTPGEISRVTFIKGDITDLESISRGIREFRANRIVHLAAMQLPFCQASPPLGALVNVQGTVNLFEAAKKNGIRQVVFASSTAVYSPMEDYPDGPLPHDAPLLPRSHYGVYKLTNEWTARVYWMNDTIASIGLRPYVVYGPGRDQGMTSTPTKAMLAAAMRKPYRISYGRRFGFQYTDDVAKAFIDAARVSFEGAEVFNIGGCSVSMDEVTAAIEEACPSAKGTITYEDIHLPFPEEVDNSSLVKLIGEYRETPLKEGVKETIALFRKALSDGKISQDSLL